MKPYRINTPMDERLFALVGGVGFLRGMEIASASRSRSPGLLRMSEVPEMDDSLKILEEAITAVGRSLGKRCTIEQMAYFVAGTNSGEGACASILNALWHGVDCTDGVWLS